MSELDTLKEKLLSDNVHVELKTIKAGLTYPEDFLNDSPK